MRTVLFGYLVLAIGVLLALAGVWSALQQNQNRVSDLQAARVASCVQTYNGVRQVFKPFFRTKSVRTAKEQRNIDKFNRRINQLIASCPEQTKASK